MSAQAAIRAVLGGEPREGELREQILAAARRHEVLGWVRREGDGTVRVHAEGPPDAVAELVAYLESASSAEIKSVPVEGHEQFAVRGVSAGRFLVTEHAATTRHFDFRLEVDGVMRSWAVPKGPSLDPAAKRLAVEVPDHAVAEPVEGLREHGGVIVWDHGSYEQGGRVPWPEALERGHAVFVLHGEKLRGGFALQRTRPGAKPGWLLVKRRDADARPGSDVVAEQPRSVLSDRTLDEVLGANP